MKNPKIDVFSYASAAIPHLSALVERNQDVMEKIAARLVADVQKGKSLFVFGSGHSSIFPMEIYHRAGGPSFVIPLVADYLLPTAGPPVVRLLERTSGAANVLLSRAQPRKGEMLWLASQSGINSAVIDLALSARKQGMRTVAFTSVLHSSAVTSRHPSGKRLFEVCDEVVDLHGHVGDAAIQVGRPKDQVFAGPLSSLGAILMAHSILVAAADRLEKAGVRCVYTSVNTSTGEARNQSIEAKAALRDPLLR